MFVQINIARVSRCLAAGTKEKDIMEYVNQWIINPNLIIVPIVNVLILRINKTLNNGTFITVIIDQSWLLRKKL